MPTSSRDPLGRDVSRPTGPFLSATQLQAYLMCPLRYRYRYVDKLPVPFKRSGLAFGSAVHAAIAWWLMERLAEGKEPTVNDVVRVFRADWEAQKCDTLRFKEGETEEWLLDQGDKLLVLFCRDFHGRKVRAVEQPFEVPVIEPGTGEVFPFMLRGYFDLLLENDTVGELKTLARAYSPDTIRGNVQFSAYCYAYETMTRRPARLEVISLLKLKSPRIETEETSRTARELRWFVGLAAAVWKAIQKDAFPPNPGWGCPDCEYAEACGGWTANSAETQGTHPVAEADAA